MASGPMRQSIPLADTVRAMAGDASGLVKELERERKKLEREIQKTLESAGSVDGKLTQKLNDLNKREQAARIYADRDARTSGARRDMMAVRSFGNKVSGVAELASGRFGLNNIQDAGELLSAAGGRLAQAGHIGAGNRLASLGASVAAGVASVGIPVMAAATTASVFYAMGGGLGNILFGDKDKMESQEQFRKVMQNNIWANRAKLGDQQTAFMMGELTSGPRMGLFGTSSESNPWVEAWLLRDTMRNGRKYYNQAGSEELRTHGFEYYFKRGIGSLGLGRLIREQEKESAAFVVNRMKELEAAERARQAAIESKPKSIQRRAVMNERLLAIKASEDERFEAKQTWAPW